MSDAETRHNPIAVTFQAARGVRIISVCDIQRNGLDLGGGFWHKSAAVWIPPCGEMSELVEGARLEIVCAVTSGTEGSNPSLSATPFFTPRACRLTSIATSGQFV